MPIDYDQYANKIYEHNKSVGWWDDPHRCLYECLQLVSTEVSEATEGERKNLMDDHLPARKMGEVELADALIRTLDLAGRLGFTYVRTSSKEALKEMAHSKRYWSVGKLHLWINAGVVAVADELSSGASKDLVDTALSRLIDSIQIVANVFQYDIHGAMDEKLEYNKHRADHKRENRQKEGGKAF